MVRGNEEGSGAGLRERPVTPWALRHSEVTTSGVCERDRCLPAIYLLTSLFRSASLIPEND